MRIGGRDVTTLPPRHRDLAMVFQNYALYPHMTVAANIGFGLKMRDLPKAEIATRVQRAARDPRHRPTCSSASRAQLSGGQRQRVAMGRAIVREPAAFLMDEPLSNLDAKLRVEMRAEITGAAAAARRTDALRHARPDRGDDAGRPRGVLPTACCSSSARRSSSTTRR